MPDHQYSRRENSRARAAAACVLLGALALPTLAQESPSFRVDRSALNAGGRPAQGATAASPSFRVSVDALGDAFASGSAAGPATRLDGGLLAGWRPPGEVRGLLFSAVTSLSWEPERSVGSYRVFRAALADAGGPAAPACLLQDLQGTTATDGGTPGADAGFFYLIVAVNRLGEAGTPGFAGDGTERPGGTCP